MISQYKNILTFFAHPDDETLAATYAEAFTRSNAQDEEETESLSEDSDSESKSITNTHDYLLVFEVSDFRCG